MLILVYFVFVLYKIRLILANTQIMAILIADSGSTKTDWVILKNSQIISNYQTIGFNPYFQKSQDIIQELQKHLVPEMSSQSEPITHVYYYGAGCSNETNIHTIKTALSSVFEKAEIKVHHDLLAAARALCGHQKGIACILGTGSNSGLYDGHDVIENVASVGYLFGDHGSGAHIGKTFIQAYFDGILPHELKKYFESAGFNREIILDNVYKKTMPSRYLAGISTFISKYIDHPFMYQLVKNCFIDFFNHQISHYSDSTHLPVNSVGSIGFYYQNILRDAAKEKGYQIGTIIKSPIEGLIAFHSNI